MRFPPLLAAGLSGLLLLSATASAQVVVEPPDALESPSKEGPAEDRRPTAVRQAGNAIYQIFVSDGAGLDCGAWTAATGPSHPATALSPVGRKNVLYNGQLGDPGTSDTTLRSYGSGRFYRTGPNASGDPAHDCRQVCTAADQTTFEPIEVALPGGGTLRNGWRATWELQDGAGGPQIEFSQEIAVEGPVDGSANVDNTVIRETHRVRNFGPGVFRFGLRKHWDWQIAQDDGPAMGDCTSPTEACDRSLDLTADGSLDGTYPSSYTINHDPATMTCPPGISPDAPRCDGDPLYLIAGTVGPPSALDPPPDPPDVLQFNNWDIVVSSCWWPALVDAAPCGALGNPFGDDTTISYFYGIDAGRAIVLAPGEEIALTQYVVAAEDGCPIIVEPPTLTCELGGPFSTSCAGPSTSLALAGSGTSGSGVTPELSWSTDCPGASFDDAAAEAPTLTLDTAGCAVTCTVTLTVTDADDPSVSTSCSSTVTVTDDLPPVVSCPPEPLVLPCAGGGLDRERSEVQAWLEQASAHDECSGEALTVVDDLPAFVPRGACPTDFLVTFTAVDSCGNPSSCQQLVSLVDETPPELDCPSDRLFECGEPEGDQTAWLELASAFDACDGPLPVSPERLLLEEPCPRTRIETWEFSAVDACGRTASCLATWSVTDTRPPVVTPPLDAVVECGDAGGPDTATWATGASAEDLCDGSLPVTPELVDETQPCPGTTVQTWRFSAVDGCGNVGEATATYTLRDSLAPELDGVPPNETVSCAAVPPPAAPIAVDDCDPNPTLSFSQSEVGGDCPNERVITRSWTATDACGNATTASQVLTVVDAQAPVLDGVPGNLTVECDEIPPPASPTATDDCGPAALTLSVGELPGDCPNERLITRTWTARDECGNETVQSQVLTVVDTTPPILSGVPADETVECDAIPPPASPTATDACGPAEVLLSVDESPGSCPNERTITRTWTARDACGNESVGVQVLTVVDTNPPELAGVPADATVDCDAVPAPATVTAVDSCGPASVSFQEVRIDGSCPQTYELVRTWTALDECGNESSAVQHLQVVDTEAPTFLSDPEDAVVECDAVPPPPAPEAIDACSTVLVLFAESLTELDCPQHYLLERTWTARDECGNESFVEQTLEVRDTQPPVFSGVPADATVDCDSVPDPASPTATDACGVVTSSFAETRADGPCPHEYVLTRRWTAVDECGNEATAARVLTVVDRTPPLLSVPEPLVLECLGPSGVPASDPRVQAWLSSASATDDCTDPVVVTHDAPAAFPLGCPEPVTVPVTFSATDACGNESLGTSSVTVLDTTPPVIESVDLPGCLWPPNHRYACFEDLASRIVATDNCDAEPSIRFAGCTSDQPDEAPEEGDRGGRELGNGDGRSFDDCVLAPDGSAACLRSERQGTDPGGRHYTLLLAVSDGCGNTVELPWTVHVPHDQRDHDCEKLDNRALLKKGEPFPWE